MTAFSSSPPSYDSYYFFGEQYRTFFNHLHITDGAKAILAFDLLKIVLETIFFSSFVGYLDAFIVLHVSWTFLGYCGCLVGFIRQKYYWFWPYLTLKIVECVTCFVCLVIIFVLIVAGGIGSNILTEMIKWKYRRVERGQALSFSLMLFVVIAILLILNSIIFDIIFRSQLYYKRRSLCIYQLQRQVVMRKIII